MNIWIIQIGEQLPIGSDIRKMRSLYLAEKFASKGYNVVWWASAFNHLRKSWYFKSDNDYIVVKGLKIKLLKGIGYKSNNSIFRFIDHRLITFKFKKKIQTEARPSLIIASTPAYDLAYQAVKFGKQYNIPTIVDVRDKWPDHFLNFFPSKYSFFLKFILANEFKMLEVLLNDATSITSMSKSVLDWALLKAGRSKTETDKVFYLGYEPFDDSKNYTFDNISVWEEKFANKFIILFIGTFGVFHNPEILIDCAKKIGNKDILFVIAGDGNLKKYLIQKANGLENVYFTGWVGKSQINYLLSVAKIGICPTTLDGDKFFFPNKVFLYWSASLPVGSAFKGEIENVIENEKLGFNFRNVDELYDSIMELYHDKYIYSQFSNNVKIVFDNKYNAEKIYDSFLLYLENFLKD